jgi:hypothetical protein
MYIVGSSTSNSYSYPIITSVLTELVEAPASAITGTAPNQTVTLPGNWKTSTEAGASTSSVNTDVVIGYEYEFEVELPKIHVFQYFENPHHLVSNRS